MSTVCNKSGGPLLQKTTLSEAANSLCINHSPPANKKRKVLQDICSVDNELKQYQYMNLEPTPIKPITTQDFGERKSTKMEMTRRASIPSNHGTYPYSSNFLGNHCHNVPPYNNCGIDHVVSTDVDWWNNEILQFLSALGDDE
eukprot:1965176-Ditylum_brightwellii.AAC.1